MAIHIPDDPDTFFREFFPEQFRTHRQRFPAEDTAGAAVYHMPEHGVWSFRVRDGELDVGSGRPDDTLLQLEAGFDDFHAVFIERTRREVEKLGHLSDESKDALKPLLLTHGKRSICESASQTLVLRLDYEGVPRRIAITPGANEPTEARATVMMRLKDFLAVQAGKASTTALFLTARLRVKGDITYALKLNGLLS